MRGKIRGYQRRLTARGGARKDEPSAPSTNEDLMAEAQAIAQSVDTAEFSTLVDAYAANPTISTGTKLFGFAMVVLAQRGTSGIGPVLAAIDVVMENKHDPFSAMREMLAPTRPGWNDYHIARWSLTHDVRELRELHRRAAHLERSPELPPVCCVCGHEVDIRGMLTHTPKVCKSNVKKPIPSTDEVIASLGWNPVIDSVNWAIGSLKEQYPDFKAGMERVEQECDLCRSPLYNPAVHADLKEKKALFCAKCGYGEHLTLECPDIFSKLGV